MVTILGLLAALGYGAADFLGGAASRRSTVFNALLLSTPVGLALMFLIAAGAGGTPTPASLGWGLASGLAGGTGLISFYRALARGPMSVVAPVSALAAAIIPVMVGAARGERLNAAALAGVALCLLAIGLVSMEPGGKAEPKQDAARFIDSGPVMAAVSGACFGVFFVMIKQAGSSGGLWPLVAARGAGLAILLTVLAVRGVRPAGLRDRGFVALAVASGAIDSLANVLYSMAAQRGMLSLAAVLTSLYPAVTVLLARTVYSERLRRIQQVGMAVAVAGIALVTVG